MGHASKQDLVGLAAVAALMHPVQKRAWLCFLDLARPPFVFSVHNSLDSSISLWIQWTRKLRVTITNLPPNGAFFGDKKLLQTRYVAHNRQLRATPLVYDAIAGEKKGGYDSVILPFLAVSLHLFHAIFSTTTLFHRWIKSADGDVQTLPKPFLVPHPTLEITLANFGKGFAQGVE